MARGNRLCVFCGCPTVRVPTISNGGPSYLQCTGPEGGYGVACRNRGCKGRKQGGFHFFSDPTYVPVSCPYCGCQAVDDSSGLELNENTS